MNEYPLFIVSNRYINNFKYYLSKLNINRYFMYITIIRNNNIFYLFLCNFRFFGIFDLFTFYMLTSILS